MNFKDYQTEAARSAPNTYTPENLRENLGLGGMGMAGEAGETCDLLKKVLYHAKPLDAATAQKLKLELGDQLWYIAHTATTLGFRLEEVAEANIEKLRARFPQGFTPADAAAKKDELLSR